MNLPNLFIIGAMKAGTSSLHEYLHQHPQIFMSRFKEPQYFAPHTTRSGIKWGQGNPCPEPNIDWYLRLFEDAGDVKYAGESSVSYTAVPTHSGCHDRIYAFNPAARLIYIMRDPVERALSHYWHFVASGCEDRDPLKALQSEPEYIARSNYAMQLRPYLERFGRDRLFAITLEELNADPVRTFRALFEWLGVDPDVSVDTTERHNVRSDELRQTRRNRVFVDTMLNHWRWKRVGRHLPSFVPGFIERLTYRSIRRADVDVLPAVEYLRPILEEHTRELGDLLGRDFRSYWPASPRNRNEPAVLEDC